MPYARETERLRDLHDLHLLDSDPEPLFDALAQAVSLLCGTPIALVSLVDTDRQWFKANVGLPGATQTPRAVAFCAHAIQQDELFVVPDATLDPRFATNPLVTGRPDVRFYAGAPLRLRDGSNVGTLCVIDRVPRTLNEVQRQMLSALAAATASALEQRRDALASAQREEAFQCISDASPFGVFATDADGACTYTNPEWQAIFGLTGADSLGDGWASAIHPDDRDAVFGAWTESAERRAAFDETFRIFRPDRTQSTVRAVARPIVQSGAILRFVGSVEDVTQRLAAESAIQAQAHRLSLILEATGAGTWEWNVQTGETRFNERWAQIIGLSLEDLGDTTIDTWIGVAHPEDHAHCSALLEAHFRGDEPAYVCEARMRHRDGHWVWVLDRGRVMTWTPDGKPEWMFGTHIDLTERKRQAEALERSEWLLNRTGALAQVGGWVIELADGIPRWTDQTCRIHGVPTGHVPTFEEAVSFYPPEARQAVEAAVSHALATGEAWDLELPFLRADGTALWVRAVGEAEFEDGAPVRLLGAFQDITRRIEQRRAIDRARERMTLANDAAGVGVWEYDLLDESLVWDAQMYRLYGLEPQDGHSPFTVWTHHLHPEDKASSERRLQEAISGGRPFNLDFRVVWPNGSTHVIHTAAEVLRDAGGQAIRMIGVNWDITQQKHLERAIRDDRSRLQSISKELADQHELMRVTLESIADAVITTDREGTVTWMNPVATRMTGWSPDEARGRPLASVFDIVHAESRLPAPNPVASCLSTDEVAGLAEQTVLRSRGGPEFGIEESAAPIQASNGELLGVVVVFHDVTEQRRISSEMTFRATHDALTGLINRVEFENRLDRKVAQAQEDGSENVLMFIDLDQFKIVNDSCGHAVGDLMLQRVAKLLAEHIRGRDTLARLGGDEFAILLEHCSIDNGYRIAQQICTSMDAFRFLHEGRAFRIGTSIGLVGVDASMPTMASVLQAADASCYAAKEAGRNRVHIWCDCDETMAARQGETQWATRIASALDHDRFVLYGQRISAIQDRSASHTEVLLRMLDDDGSIIPPGAFLPAAERFGLASRLDTWVLRTTLGHLGRIPTLSALDVDTLNVNLSGQSIGDRAFHQRALDMLDDAGPEVCSRLCLEITETAAITNMANATVFISAARARGVRIALDDFGAGASSFGYLKQLPVDIIKIDGQFIQRLLEDPLDDATVRCFIDIANVLGVKTVAEFVDRPEVLVRLRELGVDYAQGYLLHKPEPLLDALRAREQPEEAWRASA